MQKCRGDQYPLFHAFAEAGHATRPGCVFETQRAEARSDALSAPDQLDFVELSDEVQVLDRCEGLVQRPTLGHQAELAFCLRRFLHDVEALDPGRPGVGPLEASEDLDRRGFAGAIGTQIRQDLTGLGAE
jgi:hypothetical protein